MLTSGHLRAARALLRWEQQTLASKANVSVETIKRLEKMDGQLDATRVATVNALKAALESAGVQFIPENGGGPGVRLVSRATSIEPPQIVSSSNLSVRLTSRSTRDQIVINIERAAIDDYFRLTNSSSDLRRKIVAANIGAVARISGRRYVEGKFSRGETNGRKFVQIVLRLDDLKTEALTEPE